MAQSKAAAVPQKYMRAAMCGLRNIARRGRSARIQHSSGKMLDKALRYAEAYQSNSAKRWKQLALKLPPFASGTCLSHEKGSSIDCVQTLQHLVSSEKGDDNDLYAAEDTALKMLEETQAISLTFFEKQQARLHAVLQQWVVYSALLCSRAEFIVRQSRVSAVLLLFSLHVVPSSCSNSKGANSLGASVRRRGAQAYVDLLVRHRLNMERDEEWEALCAVCSSLQRPQLAGSKESSKHVMVLPLLHLSNLDASWERSFALLSWAMHFNKKQKQEQRSHISSVDIAFVLEQCVQHFGERTPKPADDDGDEHAVMLGGATEQAVVARLRQWWAAAREAEQQNPGLAEACRLDRTALSQIHVEGRKVILMASAATSAAGDVSFAELLFQQRWEEVLRSIRQVAAEALRRHNQFLAQVRHFEEKKDDCGGSDDVVFFPEEGTEGSQCSTGTFPPCSLASADSLMTLFFGRPRPLVVKSKLWVHASASRLGRVPRILLNAPMTQTEAELLRNPPTTGLRCRQFFSVGENGKQQELKNNFLDSTEIKSHSFFFNSSAALKELRYKMWIHGQIPRHVPHTLVRFEGFGAAMLPYVLRCPAKELAPWFLLCNIAAVAREQDLEQIYRALECVHTQTLYTIFSPVTYYASFQEYCAELVLQLGCLLVPLRVMRVAVRCLFRPPSFRHFYDVINGRRIPIETSCRQLLWGSLEVPAEEVKEYSAFSLSSFSHTAINFLRLLSSDSDTLREFFTCKAVSLRNYHVSTWIETCSKVESFSGLMDIFVQEINSYGPPLLSPEAAAAFLTTVLLQDVTLGEGKSEDTTSKTLQELGVVYFVVPTDRAFGAASYFKGIYDERYITSTTLEWTATSWNGAEALLVGRSIRRITKDPTTTKEIFFSVSQRRPGCNHYFFPSVKFKVPALRLRLMMVDLLKAKLHFESQGELQSRGQEVTKDAVLANKPTIVAKNLPFGIIAVNKPAGTSTTLHACYPHMINFLIHSVPWRDTVTPPALFQRGLVNRIDVGTSGLILVADTEASLTAARRASTVDRCVEKTYQALVVHCAPPASRMGSEECWYLSPNGVITRNVVANGADFSLQLMVNDQQKKGSFSSLSTNLQPATTFYRVLRYFPISGIYHVEVRLCSGRRHQIRQHFAQLWHPLVGDGRYNERAKSVGERLGLYRPALHAFRITLSPFSYVGDQANDGSSSVMPTDLEKTVVECPLPDDMQRALRLLQDKEG